MIRKSEQFRSYDELALVAGREAGLDTLDPAAVADDPRARELRDVKWGQFERRLRDTKTYTLKDVREWLADAGIKIGLSSVHRARLYLLEKESRITLAAQKAEAVVKACETAGLKDLLAGGHRLAAQVIFEALADLPSGTLAGLKPGGVVKMIEVFGKLSTAIAETELVAARTRKLQGELDKAKAAADAQAEKVLADSGVDPETINRIRQLYGLPRLEEIAA